jgi:Tfp pilus assembly protein PilX
VNLLSSRISSLRLLKNILKNLAKAVVENAERLEAASSKERLETWKFAAEEIVDLLKTVRQEGEGGTHILI